MMRRTFYCTLFLLFSATACEGASGDLAPLLHANIDLSDQASLQRGARLYMNYCAGCHSLHYMRFQRMAKDLGIVNPDGEVDKKLVEENLIFNPWISINETLTIAMPAKDADEWFGMLPPDLSLSARVRGADWLYTYLMDFYDDPKKPLGINNWLFPDVAMPNVLENLQGIQYAVYRKETIHTNGKTLTTQVIKYLTLVKQGHMDPQQFASSARDLVNFLVYVGEPIQLKRIHLGYWVIGFLLIFLIPVYLLKKEYWKDVK